MEPKLKGSPREFGKIQDHGRISIPKRFRDALNWIDGDQIMLYVHSKDKILIENLASKWREE